MILGKTARSGRKSLIFVLVGAAPFLLGLSPLAAQYGYQSIISTTNPLLKTPLSISAPLPTVSNSGVIEPSSEKVSDGGFSDYSMPQKVAIDEMKTGEEPQTTPTLPIDPPLPTSTPPSTSPATQSIDDLIDEWSDAPSDPESSVQTPIQTASVLEIPPIHLGPTEEAVRPSVKIEAPVTTARSRKPVAMSLSPMENIVVNTSTEPNVSVKTPAPAEEAEQAVLPELPDYAPVTLTSGKMESPESIPSATGIERRADVEQTVPLALRSESTLTHQTPTTKPKLAPQRVAMADVDPPRSGMLSEPTNADGILPPPNDYQLTQDEAELLNQFLEKWEEFGRDIKKVSCSVSVMEQDGGLYGKNKKTPLSHTFGKFRFISPNKLSYHIEGEFAYDQETPSDEKSEPEFKKGSGEMKFVCDGRSWTEYDFKNRVAVVTPIPESQWNQDLTVDGPFPLFFIAKADNLKRRFYLKIVTKPERQDKEVWIEAWPRQTIDAQSFQRIIVTLRLSDLQPYYMRKYYANGKSYSELWFKDIAINKGLWNIDSKIDFGWKREVRDELAAAESKTADEPTDSDDKNKETPRKKSGLLRSDR